MGGDRAVECARLENELGVKAYVGSNPTLPATKVHPSAIRSLSAADLLFCLYTPYFLSAGRIPTPLTSERPTANMRAHSVDRIFPQKAILIPGHASIRVGSILLSGQR